MAGSDDRPRGRSVQAGPGRERFVTVGTQPGYWSQAVPWIRLRGQWLAAAGFAPRQAVRVRVMAGCIVLTAE